mgnify:CR=1 FL=1
MLKQQLEFNENGYLKNDFYEIDLLTFEDYFVKAFPFSTT